jgi:hypothetical protein
MGNQCVDIQYTITIYVIFPILVKLRRLAQLKRGSGHKELEVICIKRFVLVLNDLQVMFKCINLVS